MRLRCLHKAQRRLVDAGIPAAIVTAMQQHAEHGAVQQLGRECLGLVAGCSASLGTGVHPAVAPMRARPQHRGSPLMEALVMEPCMEPCMEPPPGPVEGRTALCMPHNSESDEGMAC